MRMRIQRKKRKRMLKTLMWMIGSLTHPGLLTPMICVSAGPGLSQEDVCECKYVHSNCPSHISAQYLCQPGRKSWPLFLFFPFTDKESEAQRWLGACPGSSEWTTRHPHLGSEIATLSQSRLGLCTALLVSFMESFKNTYVFSGIGAQMHSTAFIGWPLSQDHNFECLEDLDSSSG